MRFTERDMETMISRGMAKVVALELRGNLISHIDPMRLMLAVLDESISPRLFEWANVVMKDAVRIAPYETNGGDPVLRRELFLITTPIIKTFQHLKQNHSLIIAAFCQSDGENQVASLPRLIRFK